MQAPSPEALKTKSDFLKAFEAVEKAYGDADRPAIRRLRNAAIARFDQLAFPTTRDEEWRFTPLTSLYQHRFELPSRLQKLPQGKIQDQLLDLPGAIRLVFVNGHFERSLSHLEKAPAGCTLLSLRDVLELKPELVEANLGRLASIEHNTFAALNTAFLQDGVVLHLAKEVVLRAPIHLAFFETGVGVMTFPRILVVLERHSQATIVETHQSLGETPDFTAAVSEFLLAEETKLDHYRVNDVSPQSFHFATQQVRQQARGSNFRSHALTLGGALVRNDLLAHLAAENCECTLNGLYMADGTRLIDNHTTIDHAMPHCPSHELYKGILTDKGKGVFNGKIMVRQDAQKTDAKQTNQTLLLSPDATIDTKPQLEIFADDVKCTHGATVGQLDDEMQFYLRTRGIGPEQAQAMLTYAFANDILHRIEVNALREQLEQRFLTPEV
jgi:Fe-S cluster assembly protein SufD